LSRLLRKPISRSSLPGKPDFVYQRARLAVFVHGDWWHRCPVCNIPLPRVHRAYWKRKLDRNVERDRLVKMELQALRWRVVEIWEHEIKSDPKAAADRIKRLLKTS
jgi:DNA mismatch endonuclease, patch repair protein